MNSRNRLLAAFLLLCFILVIMAGCRNVRRQTVATLPVKTVVPKEPDPPSQIFMPDDDLDPVYKGLNRKVTDFYRRHGYRPVWSGSNGLSRSGDSLVRFISNIRYYGLSPSSYHLEEIIAIPDRGLTSTLRLDGLLTDAFLSIAKDLMYGRLRPRDNVSDSIAAQLLDSVTTNGGLRRCLSSVETQLEGYRQLKGALKLLLDSLSESGRVTGLENSGGISDSLHARVQRIELDLERWRSEKQSWGSHYIFVNIPAFMLYVISDGAVVMESRVIVGKPETSTPEFTSMVECMVTYPYWHVPRKIAVEEYLPIIQRDTSFLGRNNFDVLDRSGVVVAPDSLEWSTFSRNYFPVSLRQREGAENSMGILKFVFDNPYAVFLHDTNVRRLFGSDIRAFSHGCIRMEKAVELSHYLLTGDVNKRSSLIDRYLSERLRHSIELQASVPIHIRYFTSAVTEGGIVFYEDIYHKNDSLIETLFGKKTELND